MTDNIIPFPACHHPSGAAYVTPVQPRAHDYFRIGDSVEFQTAGNRTIVRGFIIQFEPDYLSGRIVRALVDTGNMRTWRAIEDIRKRR